MLDATGGEGFRLLTGATTSPTLKRQIAELLQRWPAARWHRFEPVDDTALHAATWQAFGRSFDIAPLLDQAHATIAFDADPLGPGLRLVLNSLRGRSEGHTSELPSLMRISYADFRLKKQHSQLQ